MSPRAAWRLESLGFTKVYDYVAGKADWAVAGLPREGEAAGSNRVVDVVRRNVPTCPLGTRLGDVGGRAQVGGKDMCIVVNEEGVVLGRMRGAAFDREPGTAVEDIMEEGPTTIRPDEMLRDVIGRMLRRGVDSIIVSTVAGRLVGILYRDDAEWALGEQDGDDE